MFKRFCTLFCLVALLQPALFVFAQEGGASGQNRKTMATGTNARSQLSEGFRFTTLGRWMIPSVFASLRETAPYGLRLPAVCDRRTT